MLTHSLKIARPGLVIVELSGKMAQGTTLDQLTNAIWSTCEGGRFDMILDMQDVEAIDSMGLGFLVVLRSKLSNWDGNLILARPQERVNQVLETTKITRLMPVAETLEDARRQARLGADEGEPEETPEPQEAPQAQEGAAENATAS